MIYPYQATKAHGEIYLNKEKACENRCSETPNAWTREYVDIVIKLRARPSIPVAPCLTSPTALKQLCRVYFVSLHFRSSIDALPETALLSPNHIHFAPNVVREVLFILPRYTSSSTPKSTNLRTSLPPLPTHAHPTNVSTCHNPPTPPHRHPALPPPAPTPAIFWRGGRGWRRGRCRLWRLRRGQSIGRWTVDCP